MCENCKRIGSSIVRANLKRSELASNVNHMDVDGEWVELMKEARDTGLSREHIRSFIKETSMIKNA